MGMRARLERELRGTTAALRVSENMNLGDHPEKNEHARRALWYLSRRAHLLEFVLSGRYAELELQHAQRKYLGDALQRHFGGERWHNYDNVRPDPNHSCSRGMDCPLYWQGYSQ